MIETVHKGIVLKMRVHIVFQLSVLITGKYERPKQLKIPKSNFLLRIIFFVCVCESVYVILAQFIKMF